MADSSAPSSTMTGAGVVVLTASKELPAAQHDYMTSLLTSITWFLV
jgi:hypothetical protein